MAVCPVAMFTGDDPLHVRADNEVKFWKFPSAPAIKPNALMAKPTCGEAGVELVEAGHRGAGIAEGALAIGPAGRPAGHVAGGVDAVGE